LGRDHLPISGSEVGNEWRSNYVPPYKSNGVLRDTFISSVGYKKGLVETRRQGIPTVLQSKFDIASLFIHRNLWRYIEGGDKSKGCTMNFFSQAVICVTLRFDCIGPNRTNSLHTM